METGKLSAALLLGAFAIQRIVELLDWPLTRMAEKTAPNDDPKARQMKKYLTSLLATSCGFLIAHFGDLRAMHVAGLLENGQHPCVDFIVTSLALGSGTDGANSVLKYLGYVKRAKEATAMGMVLAGSREFESKKLDLGV